MVDFHNLTSGRTHRRHFSDPSVPSTAFQDRNVHHQDHQDVNPLSQRLCRAQAQAQRDVVVPISGSLLPSFIQQPVNSPPLVQEGLILPVDCVGQGNADSHNDVNFHEGTDERFQHVDIDDNSVNMVQVHSYRHEGNQSPACVDSRPRLALPLSSSAAEPQYFFASAMSSSAWSPSSPFSRYDRNMYANSSSNDSGCWAVPSISSVSNMMSGHVVSSTRTFSSLNIDTAVGVDVPSSPTQATTLQDRIRPRPLFQSLNTTCANEQQQSAVATNGTTCQPPLFLSFTTMPNSNFHGDLAVPARAASVGQPFFRASQVAFPNSFSLSMSPSATESHLDSPPFGSFSLNLSPSASATHEHLSHSTSSISEGRFVQPAPGLNSLAFPQSISTLPALSSTPSSTISPPSLTTLGPVIATGTVTAITPATTEDPTLTVTTLNVGIPEEINAPTPPLSPVLQPFGPVFVTELYNTPPTTPPLPGGFHQQPQAPPFQFLSLYSDSALLTPPVQPEVPIGLDGDDSSSENDDDIDTTITIPASSHNTGPAPVNNSSNNDGSTTPSPVTTNNNHSSNNDFFDLINSTPNALINSNMTTLEPTQPASGIDATLYAPTAHLVAASAGLVTPLVSRISAAAARIPTPPIRVAPTTTMACQQIFSATSRRYPIPSPRSILAPSRNQTPYNINRFHHHHTPSNPVHFIHYCSDNTPYRIATTNPRTGQPLPEQRTLSVRERSNRRKVAMEAINFQKQEHAQKLTANATSAVSFQEQKLAATSVKPKKVDEQRMVQMRDGPVRELWENQEDDVVLRRLVGEGTQKLERKKREVAFVRQPLEPANHPKPQVLSPVLAPVLSHESLRTSLSFSKIPANPLPAIIEGVDAPNAFDFSTSTRPSAFTRWNQNYRATTGHSRVKGKRINNNNHADKGASSGQHRKIPQERRLQQNVAIVPRIQRAEDVEVPFTFTCRGYEDLSRKFPTHEEGDQANEE